MTNSSGSEVAESAAPNSHGRSAGASKKPGATLKTVDRALTLLRCLAEAGRALTMREIAEQVEVNLTTAYHLVNTLTAHNFATRTGGRVELGPSAALLTGAYRRMRPVSEELERVVRELADLTGETTYLGEWTGTNVVVRTVSESSASVRVAGIDVGYSGREHIRASGLVVMALLSEDEREKFIAHLQASGLDVDVDALHDTLAQVVRDGHAEERGVFSPGAACVAAPYFSGDGTVGGAITVSAPLERFNVKRESLLEALKVSAAELTERLALEG